MLGAIDRHRDPGAVEALAGNVFRAMSQWRAIAEHALERLSPEQRERVNALMLAQGWPLARATTSPAGVPSVPGERLRIFVEGREESARPDRTAERPARDREADGGARADQIGWVYELEPDHVYGLRRGAVVTGSGAHEQLELDPIDVRVLRACDPRHERSAKHIADLAGVAPNVALLSLRRLRGQGLVEVGGAPPARWLRRREGDVALEARP